jgi:hypothetical protein
MGGYVDDEGGTLAPWMMPPEDQSHYSNRDQATQPSSSSSHYQVLRCVNTVSMCRYVDIYMEIDAYLHVYVRIIYA